MLSAQTGSHQGKQNRGRANKWHDADTVLLRQGDEFGARVGDGGATSLGKETGIEAGQ